MSKPAFGTPINTGDADGLSTSLAHAWGILEANGATTLVDSQSGDTATLASGQSVSSQALVTSGSTAGASLATAVALPVSGTAKSFSLAWGASGTGMVFGDIDSTVTYIWAQGGGTLDVNIDSASVSWTGLSFSSYSDWVLSISLQSGTTYSVSLYQNGSLVGSAQTLAVPGAAQISAIGAGYNSAGYGFNGSISYFYVWTNRALSSTDASNLHSTPYESFGTESIVAGNAACAVSSSADSASVTINSTSANCLVLAVQSNAG